MAIWQCDINLVKQDFIDVNSDPFFDYVDENSLNEISAILPKGKSWSKDIVVYGNHDTTCIELFHEDNILKEITIRIDLRNISKPILDAIWKFIEENNAKIFSNKSIKEGTYKNFCDLIKDSDAFAYCKNPKEFCEKLSNKTN